MNCHFDRNIEYLDPQLTKANWWLHIFYEHVYFCVGRLRVKDPAKIGKLCWQISHCMDYSSCIEHSAIESPDTLVTFSRTGRQKTATASQLDMIISITVYKVRCKFSADSHTIPQEIYVGNGCAVSDICSVCSSPTWNDELSSFLGDGLLKPTNITINRW